MISYRKGGTLVRLTLHAEDFEPWFLARERYPQWTAEQIRRLETLAAKRSETHFECWWVRAEPLPLSHVIRAEAKSYTERWQDIALVSVQHPGDPRVRGIALGDEMHCSTRMVIEGKPTAYLFTKVSRAEVEGGFAKDDSREEIVRERGAVVSAPLFKPRQ
jgi:hypothetical protein